MFETMKTSRARMPDRAEREPERGAGRDADDQHERERRDARERRVEVEQ